MERGNGAVFDHLPHPRKIKNSNEEDVTCLTAKSNTTSALNRYFHPSPCRALKVMNDDSFIFSGPAHGPLFGQNHEDKSLAKPLHVQRIENALR